MSIDAILIVLNCTVLLYAGWIAAAELLELKCFKCHRPRFGRDAEGYRRCRKCGTGWKSEAVNSAS